MCHSFFSLMAFLFRKLTLKANTLKKKNRKIQRKDINIYNVFDILVYYEYDTCYEMFL